MMFWALFAGLLAAESLAMPHHSFLHEVDFPGEVPENSSKIEPAPAQPSVTAPSTPDVSDIVKREIRMGVLNITEILNNQTSDANVSVNESNTAPNLVTAPSTPGVSDIVKRAIMMGVLNITEILSNQTSDANVSVNESNTAPNLVTAPSTPGVSDIVKRAIMMGVLNITEILSNQTSDANVSVNEPNTAPNLVTAPSTPGVSDIVKRAITMGVLNITEILSNQTIDANVSVNEPNTAPNLVTAPSTPGVSDIVKRAIMMSVLNITEILSNQTSDANVSVNEPNTAPNLVTAPSTPVDLDIVKREIMVGDLNITEILSNQTSDANVSVNEPNTAPNLVTAPSTPGDLDIVKREIMMGDLNITEILSNQTSDANVSVNEPNTAPNLMTAASSPGVSEIVKRDVSSQAVAEEAVLNAAEIRSNQTNSTNVSVNEIRTASNQGTATSSPGVSGIVKRAVLNDTEIQNIQAGQENESVNEPSTPSNLATVTSSPGVSGIVKREISSQEVTVEAVLNVTELQSNQTENANASVDEPSTAPNLATAKSSPGVSVIVKRKVSNRAAAEEAKLNFTEIQSNQTGKASASTIEPNTAPDQITTSSSSDVSIIAKRDMSEGDGKNSTNSSVNNTNAGSEPLMISVVDKREVSGENESELISIQGSADEAVQDGTKIQSTAEPNVSVPNAAEILSTAPTTPGVPEILKRDISEVSSQNDAKIAGQNATEVLGNQTTIQQENTSLPSVAGDISSMSSVSLDQMFKERILRSIIEGEADLKVNVSQQPTLKSDKCQCPSGECSGEVCKLVDFTSLATKTVEPTSTVPASPENLSRSARSSPNDTTATNDVSTTDLASADNANNTVPVSSSQTVSSEIKATVESHIQKIQPRHSRSTPDVTIPGIGASQYQNPHDQQVSVSPGVKLVTLNESEIIQDPKAQTKEQADAVKQNTASVPDQSSVNRQKRDSEETLGDLMTLSDEEMAYGGETPEPTSTVKLAPDAPTGFEAPNAVHLERSSRLYLRSVLEPENSDDTEPRPASIPKEANSGSELEIPVPTVAPITEKETVRVPRQVQVNPNVNDPTSNGISQGVSPSITAPGANEGSGKTPDISATGGAASVSAQVSASSPETPMSRSDPATVGITDSRVELPGDILPKSAEDREKHEDNELTRTRYVRSVQDGGNIVEAANTDAASSSVSQIPAKTIVQDVKPDGSIGAQTSNMPAGSPTGGAGAIDAENQDVSSDTGIRRRRLTTYILPKSTTTDKANASGASTEADASTNLPATATAVNAVEGGANATEIRAESTEAAKNASDVAAKAGENAAGNPEKVSKPNTSAAASQPAVKQPQPQVIETNENPSITHRRFMHPRDDAEKEKSPRDEQKKQEKEEAAREQEERRLGEISETEDHPDLGSLDIRTMGGNQLDIDPVNLHGDRNTPKDKDKATVMKMDQTVSSSNHLSAFPFLPLVALLSSRLTSLLPTVATYLST